MIRALRLFLKDDAAIIAPATAVVMAVLIGMVGLVTDTSVWYAQRRQLQGVTDAAALAAARYATTAGSATTAATSVLTNNGLNAAALVSVQTGSYCDDSTLSVAARFQTAGCPGAATVTPNAVKVSTTINSPLFLSKLFISGDRQINVVSTAARVNQAGIQAGSGVASLDGGIANALLQALTGSSVSLSAAQYTGLLNTNVSALSFLDALATRLNINAGNYSSVMSSNVGVGDVIAAELAVLNKQSQTASVSAAVAGLTQLQGQIAGNPSINIGKLFDLGMWQNDPIGSGSSTQTSALQAGINAYQLVSFTLQLANGNHAAQIPSSSIGIPNLVTISVAATAIEPPVGSFFAFGPVGTSVHTAQVRLKLTLQVLNLVPQLGVGVSVPLYIEVGSGDATITSISCNGSPTTDATVGVTAHGGLANVYIGAPSNDAMNNFSAPVASSSVLPVQILNLGIPGILTLATTTASAHVSVGSTTGAGTALSFVQPNGSNGVQPNPPTTNGVIGGYLNPPSGVYAEAYSTNFTSNLVGGLAQSLSAKACTISLLGGCLLPVTLTGSSLGPLYNVLNPILGSLDPVLDGVLSSLGVRLGKVDVAITGVRCGLPVLVS